MVYRLLDKQAVAQAIMEKADELGLVYDWWNAIDCFAGGENHAELGMEEQDWQTIEKELGITEWLTGEIYGSKQLSMAVPDKW